LPVNIGACLRYPGSGLQEWVVAFYRSACSARSLSNFEIFILPTFVFLVKGQFPTNYPVFFRPTGWSFFSLGNSTGYLVVIDLLSPAKSLLYFCNGLDYTTIPYPVKGFKGN
jgi:hypothetical protein